MHSTLPLQFALARKSDIPISALTGGPILEHSPSCRGLYPVQVYLREAGGLFAPLVGTVPEQFTSTSSNLQLIISYMSYGQYSWLITINRG
jgi:hypothetical protein